MSGILTNAYSQRWFDTFHANIAGERTAREVAFISNCAPLPDFQNVLDVCCGMGRHSRALAARGYSVTGLERDEIALTKARAMANGPRYVQADVRDYAPEAATYDLAIVMSQSFGYFDAATNQNVLQRLAAAVRPGGRIILDLWNPEFFALHSGRREFETPTGLVRETKRLVGDRLHVELAYPDGGQDTFEWQLFPYEAMAAAAGSAGLRVMLACTDFEVAVKPHSNNPRVHYVLERPASGLENFKTEPDLLVFEKGSPIHEDKRRDNQEAGDQDNHGFPVGLAVKQVRQIRAGVLAGKDEEAVVDQAAEKERAKDVPRGNARQRDRREQRGRRQWRQGIEKDEDAGGPSSPPQFPAEVSEIRVFPPVNDRR
jgi:SAM-dependent methyltransferase